MVHIGVIFVVLDAVEKQIRSSCGRLSCISSRRCKLPDHVEQNKQYRVSVEQLTAPLEIAIDSGMKETVKIQQRRAMKWYEIIKRRIEK